MTEGKLLEPEPGHVMGATASLDVVNNVAFTGG